MMELIDKAPALGRIDARDLFAIAEAHGGGGGGGDGGGAGLGLGLGPGGNDGDDGANGRYYIQQYFSHAYRYDAIILVCGRTMLDKHLRRAIIVCDRSPVKFDFFFCASASASVDSCGVCAHLVPL